MLLTTREVSIGGHNTVKLGRDSTTLIHVYSLVAQEG